MTMVPSVGHIPLSKCSASSLLAGIQDRTHYFSLTSSLDYTVNSILFIRPSCILIYKFVIAAMRPWPAQYQYSLHIKLESSNGAVETPPLIQLCRFFPM